MKIIDEGRGEIVCWTFPRLSQEAANGVNYGYSDRQELHAVNSGIRNDLGKEK